MSGPAPLLPKLTEYRDYRVFLRDYYLAKKSGNRRFSFRRFASQAGFKSSNFLQLVMNKKRRLSAETAGAVARAMNLSKGESELFASLVASENAKSALDALQAERAQEVAIKRIIAKELPAAKAAYLKSWYLPLVRELAFLRDFEPKASWISSRLGGLVSETQAEEAMRILVELGIWRAVDGKIAVSDVFLDTGDEERTFGELSVVEVHRQNLLAWAKLIPEVPKAERELGLINIPIDPAKIPELKERIRRFQDEIIGWLQDEPAPSEVVQLGTYLVPVTRSRISRGPRRSSG